MVGCLASCRKCAPTTWADAEHQTVGALIQASRTASALERDADTGSELGDGATGGWAFSFQTKNTERFNP